MTNCSSQKFPSTCNPADYGHKEFFMNTGEEVYYQKITGSNLPEDDVVILLRNGEYYKAILPENTINIEWYRCNKRYADDEAIIVAAVKMAAYLGATLRFDAREYIVNKQLDFQELSCFKLLGDRQHTWIKSDSKEKIEGAYFNFTDCNNFIIEGLKFDLNKSNLPVYNSVDNSTDKEYNGGIFITKSYNIKITNCYFFDLYNRAVHIYSCFKGDILVSDNLFESGLQEQSYMMEHLVIGQCSWANVVVENNNFINAENHNPDHGVVAIYAFELGEFGSVLINNNNFEYCGRNHAGGHRLYAIDFYDYVDNFIISNNTFKNLTWGAIRFDGTRKNGIINDNIFHQLIADQDGMIMVASREGEKYNQIVFKNISIHNNILDSETELSYGITIQGLSPFCAAENIDISNNKMYNLRYGITIHGDVSVVSISNNQAFNLIGIGIRVKGFKTGHGNVPLQPKKIEKIYINDNHLNGRKELSYDGFVGIQIDGLDVADKYMGRVLINNNFVTGNSTGMGIVINPGKTLENVVTIANNTLENLKRGFYIRTNKVFVKDNLIYNTSEPIDDTNVPGQTIYHENFNNNVMI
ncbi:right-handed parallel beta-helix repeat-containing protein [Chryseobacterium sp. c4a]|uniref:right-handed parallel beta-helix repeat-containing protein n=1 Tax=Chryseobacterium sp. c4a TaxID=1573582 RepID=UPI00135ABCB2|nr:right-handed parallel beta-helix repeat-containing protein [Chryseobacterium sp. c4a]